MSHILQREDMKLKRTHKLIRIKQEEESIMKSAPTIKEMITDEREELVGKIIYHTTIMGVTSHIVKEFTSKRVITGDGLILMMVDCFTTKEGADMRVLFRNMIFLERNGLEIGYADVLTRIRNEYTEYWI